MIKFSIIIPFYNVEQYIAQCLDSVYNQDIPEDEYEVICVNDASPDNSRDIVKEYQKKHKNLILVEHDVNKKVGGARNTGLQNAHGEYVWFIDSDDFIKSNVLHHIWNELNENKSNVICFNYVIKDSHKEIVDRCFSKYAIYPKGLDFLVGLFGKGIIFNLGYVVRAIYSRQLLVDYKLQFPVGLSYGEDTTFMAEAIAYAKNVISIEDGIYYYRQNENSLTRDLDTHWKALVIYQSVFVAGGIIIDWRDKVQSLSSELVDNIDCGLPWFVNSLFIKLCKSDAKERHKFFSIIRRKEKQIASSKRSVFDYFDTKNKFICKYPYIGECLLLFLGIFYRLKKRII